jgi:EmrB/QacA subfamily drug resistance transporter
VTGQARRTLALTVLCAGAFLGAVDIQLVNIAFPDMLRAFPGSDLAGLSWVFSGYTITFTVALLPAGGLADRFGYRRVYVTGLVAFVGSAAVCALAPSAVVLIAARIVQGAGGGVITPLTLALILPHYPEKRRGTAIGVWNATQSVAMASGPSLGGALVGISDWRTVFLLHVPVGLLVVAGTWWTLGGDGAAVRPRRVGREEPEARLPDLPGLVLLSAAIGLPSLAIVRSEQWGPASPRTIAALAAGIAAGVLFVRRARGHPAPIVDLGVLRARLTRRANIAMFLLGVVMFAFALANILFLTTAWGYSEAGAGLAVTPAPLAQAVSAPLAGRLSARVGHRAVAIGGVVLLAFATLDLALAAGERHAYATVILPALVVSGAAVAMLVTSLSGAAVAEVPPARLATGTALSVTSRACGAVVGMSTLALVLSAAQAGAIGAYHGVWAGMFAICALIALTVTGLRRPAALWPIAGMIRATDV